MTTFPDYPNACETLACSMRGEPVETCRDHRCPHRWQREAVEDRQRREAKDAAQTKERATNEPSACVTTDCIGMANAVEACEARRCPFVPDRKATERIRKDA